MIKRYVDNNGNMGTPLLKGDDEIKIQKQTIYRNIRESKLKDEPYNAIYEHHDIKADGSINTDSIKWDDIDSVKKAGHAEAFAIKNSNKYEDASNAEKAKLSDLHQSFLNK